MAISHLLIIFLILYGLTWAALMAGQLYIRRGDETAIQIRKFAWNGRIEQFRYPPFSYLVRFWIQKKYVSTSLIFFLVMLSADLVFLFLGTLLLSPILSMFQGGTTGILLGKSDKKNMTWSLTVCLFEFGHFAFTGALGLLITYTALLTDLSFYESILVGYKTLAAGYWLPILLCILGNTILEVAGPVYWDMKGAMGLDVLAQGRRIE